MIGLDQNNLKIQFLVQNNQKLSVVSAWKSTRVIVVMASRNAVIFFGATALFMFLKIANRKDARTFEKPLY
jgi:hypothetical protein